MNIYVPANKPMVTLFVTLVYERRSDIDKYMYSIDRCYTTITQANHRLQFLSRCNTNPLTQETFRVGEDHATGCQWSTWTRFGDDASKFRFFGEVKKITMFGAILREGPEDPQNALALLSSGGTGLAATPGYRYLFESRKDLANHVWAVATHSPSAAITVNAQGRPTTFPWALESVHEVAGNGMARGKRLWREKMQPQHGPFDRLDVHYGLARYLLVPAEANATVARPAARSADVIQGIALHALPQIRIERIRVESETDPLLAQFSPAAAVQYNRPPTALRGRFSPDRSPAAHRVEVDLARPRRASESQVDLFDPSHLSPPLPVRRVSLRSPAGPPPPPSTQRLATPPRERSFRRGVAAEYSSLAARLRGPAPSPAPRRPPPPRPRRSDEW